MTEQQLPPPVTAPGARYQPGDYPQEGQAGNLPPQAYTPWITRVGAAIIDGIPAWILLAIGFGIGIALSQGCSTDAYGNEICPRVSVVDPTWIVVYLGVLAAIAYGIWNWGYRQGTTGSSIGKSMLKFKVVSEATGQPIGFGASIMRQLAHIVDSAICYIGFLFPLWDRKRQTLADKIMKTVCLPTQEAAIRP